MLLAVLHRASVTPLHLLRARSWCSHTFEQARTAAASVSRKPAGKATGRGLRQVRLESQPIGEGAGPFQEGRRSLDASRRGSFEGGRPPSDVPGGAFMQARPPACSLACS